MLRKITWKKFADWKAFDELEPIGGRRLDYLTASIVSTLVNIHRDRKNFPDPLPLTNFLLEWGGEKKAIPKQKGKTWQELKFMGQWLAALYNQAEDRHDKRHRKKKE